MDFLSLRDRIDGLSKDHHIEIAKLLIADAVVYNENQNGIFVNLGTLSDPTYTKILNYIDFVTCKESTLTETETQKGMLLATHFKR